MKNDDPNAEVSGDSTGASVPETLRIWVDADACPKVVKDILIRAATRTRLPLIFVANQPVSVPRLINIRAVQVAAGFDVADNYIVEHAVAHDIVVTGDIPLAAELVEKGCSAVNPRGELYTTENIKQRLNMRDFMDTLRGSGIDTGGSAAYSQTDRRNFANQLDRLLAVAHSKGSSQGSSQGSSKRH